MGNSHSSTDKIIACVGPMGCGKSHIIDCLAKTKWASNSLTVGPRDIQSATIKVEGNTVVLLDTPGFDLDTLDMLPSATVRQLQGWLKKMYDKEVRLTGIIYLHPISDNRMTKILPAALKNLLKQERASQVALVTTMWDRTPFERAEGRETQLRTLYWKDVLELGAQTYRFDNKEETALQIIRELLAGNRPATYTFQSSPLPLQDTIVTPRKLKKNKETARSGSKRQSIRWKIPFVRVKAEDLSPKDVVIGVMGPTGSGKSSFIELASGINGIVGHSLRSCTDEISVIKFFAPELLDSEICLVDTPGFDDTNKSDVEIFKMVSDWLIDTYKRDIQLAGLLYFHRISDNRMAGTPLQNLRHFEELCGQEFSTIVLTTTMWDEVDLEIGEQREQELQDNYWKSMMDRGSTVKRFLYTPASVFDVLQPILTRVNEAHILRLQKEVSDLELKLKETAAGRVLALRLEELIPRQEKLLVAIRNDLMESKSRPDQLENSHQDYQEAFAQLQRVLKDVEKMKISVGGQLLNFVRINTRKGSRILSVFGPKRKKRSLRMTSSSPTVMNTLPDNGTNDRRGGDAEMVLDNNDEELETDTADPGDAGPMPHHPQRILHNLTIQPASDIQPAGDRQPTKGLEDQFQRSPEELSNPNHQYQLVESRGHHEQGS